VRTCPEVAEWPIELKRWLIGHIVRRALARVGGQHHPDAWKHILTTFMRGRRVPVPRLGHHTVPWAATSDDVYALALRLAREDLATRTTTTQPSPQETTTDARDTIT
jgi:hypothetical protein